MGHNTHHGSTLFAHEAMLLVSSMVLDACVAVPVLAIWAFILSYWPYITSLDDRRSSGYPKLTRWRVLLTSVSVCYVANMLGWAFLDVAHDPGTFEGLSWVLTVLGSIGTLCFGLLAWYIAGVGVVKGAAAIRRARHNDLSDPFLNPV